MSCAFLYGDSTVVKGSPKNMKYYVSRIRSLSNCRACSPQGVSTNDIGLFFRQLISPANAKEESLFRAFIDCASKIVDIT